MASAHTVGLGVDELLRAGKTREHRMKVSRWWRNSVRLSGGGTARLLGHGKSSLAARLFLKGAPILTFSRVFLGARKKKQVLCTICNTGARQKIGLHGMGVQPSRWR